MIPPKNVARGWQQCMLVEEQVDLLFLKKVVVSLEGLAFSIISSLNLFKIFLSISIENVN